MSKINLTPNASGTGVFTIASPNSNTNYTINLPEISGGEFVATDSSGNLLVGKTAVNSNAAGFEAESDGKIAATRDGSRTAIFNRLTSDGEIVAFRKDGTTVGSIFSHSSGNMGIGTGDTGVLFAATSETLQPWNTSTNSVRDAAIDLGVDGGRFKDLYLSGGAYLGGTAAANHLDDYEEGSWTPRYTASSGGNIGGSQVANAVYTKIGNIVTVEFYLYVSSTSVSGLSGNVHISGLPFTATGLAAPSPVRTTDDINIYGAFTNAPTMAAASGSTLFLFKQRSGQVEQFLQVGDFVAAGGNRNLVWIKHVYQA